MNCLPPELLEHIFKFLPISALGPVAQVCKTWRDLAYDDVVWEEAYARRWGKDDSTNQTTIPEVPKSGRARFIGRYAFRCESMSVFTARCREYRSVFVEFQEVALSVMDLQKRVLWRRELEREQACKVCVCSYSKTLGPPRPAVVA